MHAAINSLLCYSAIRRHQKLAPSVKLKTETTRQEENVLKGGAFVHLFDFIDGPQTGLLPHHGFN